MESNQIPTRWTPPQLRQLGGARQSDAGKYLFSQEYGAIYNNGPAS